MANKQQRFTTFMAQARQGSETLFDRPNFVSPHTARRTAQPAMFDVLQAKHEDVDVIMCNLMEHFRSVVLLFAAGDGLSFARMLQAIAADTPRYHGRTPFVIPILGITPHLEHHVAHAGWRNYRPYINMHGNLLNSWQMKQTDILVSQWNATRFELCKLLRGHAEFLIDLSQTPGAVDFSRPEEMQEAASQNIDFRWAFSFVYDFGFLWLDLMQSRRAKKLKKITLLMREFLPFGRTMEANKTNYGFMTVMFVYFNQLLHPLILDLYQQVQTLPTAARSSTPGTEVGLDWFAEQLNDFLKQDVTDHISRELVNKRIKDHDFLSRADDALMDYVHQGREHAIAKMKRMDADVAAIKAHLKNCIGSTWLQATRSNSVSKFGLDSRAVKRPWETIAKSMTTGSQGGDEHIYDYVAKHVHTYAPWHSWKP